MPGTPSYLAVLVPPPDGAPSEWEASFLDLSTGRFFAGALPGSRVADALALFRPREILLPEGVAVAIQLPQKATLEVVETEPTVKGQTASSSYKPAMLSNGVRTMVPPFVGAGTKIVVMTADGSYVERAKD